MKTKLKDFIENLIDDFHHLTMNYYEESSEFKVRRENLIDNSVTELLKVVNDKPAKTLIIQLDSDYIPLYTIVDGDWTKFSGTSPYIGIREIDREAGEFLQTIEDKRTYNQSELDIASVTHVAYIDTSY